MIDTKLLRTNPQDIANKLAKKHFTLDVDAYSDLEQSRKKLQTEAEQLQAERNKGAKEIGQAKSRNEKTDALMAKMQVINQQLEASKEQLQDVQQQLQDIELGIPNIPDSCVPNGSDEKDNRFVRNYGAIKSFGFDALDHVDLGIEKADFNSAIKLSGSRFAVLSGGLARLQRALAQFMLDVHTKEHDYKEYYLPYLVQSKVLEGAGQLPKFAEDQFHCEKDNLYLIPTAEPALVNLVRESVLEAETLPLKMVAHTPCFRREAGSYGRDTRGMFRQHQFDKVELVQVTHPEKSDQALEEITSNAEAILKKLDVPYQVVDLCGGDLGFSAVRTYDIEVWLPGQKSYREISSCSNCRDFQARRMQTRFRNSESGANELVHTLNGSGLAIGRTLIAVMENYQQADGSVAIPDVLKPYLPGVDRI